MTEARIRQRYEALAPFLNEKQRRLLAGVEAIIYGRGGQKRVATLVGMSPDTVGRGVRELRHPATMEPECVRRPGGGRKPTTDTNPQLHRDLERLVSPDTRGDPEAPLRWTCKSTRKLAAELKAMKFGRSPQPVPGVRPVHATGYSLQARHKTREGSEHPDCEAQFQHINATVAAYQKRGQPVSWARTFKPASWWWC